MSDESIPDETTGPEPTAPEQAPEFESAAAAPAPIQPSADARPATHVASGRGWLWGGVATVVVVALIVGAYFVGRSSVDQGPSSLAEAAQQTAKGDLPVGHLSLGELGKALGGSQGSILKGLDQLGGKGTSNSLLQGLLDQLGKRLEQALNGKGGSSSTPAQQAFLGVSTTSAQGQSGAQVSAVKPGGPAGDAGLQVGDVITAIDGKAVTSSSSLASLVAAQSPGDLVTVTYSRSGASASARVRLGNTSSPTTTSPSI